MTDRDTWRWSRWVQWCEHAAIVSVLPQVLRLAQEAENDAVYRSTLAWQARLHDQWQALNDELWALDPAWAQEVLAHRPAPRQPEGALEEAERRARAQEDGFSAAGRAHIDEGRRAQCRHRSDRSDQK